MPLRTKGRGAQAPGFELPSLPRYLVAASMPAPAQAHFKADAGEQVDLEDYLKGDKRPK